MNFILRSWVFELNGDLPPPLITPSLRHIPPYVETRPGVEPGYVPLQGTTWPLCQQVLVFVAMFLHLSVHTARLDGDGSTTVSTDRSNLRLGSVSFGVCVSTLRLAPLDLVTHLPIATFR